MKSLMKAVLVAPFLLMLSACNNENETGVDPVIGEYSLLLFNDLVMPISETQTEVANGVFCDIERNGVASFSNDLGFSLTVQERFSNCTDITFNEEETVVILGSGFPITVGSSYDVDVEVNNVRVSLDCNLQEDNLFCQGSNGNTLLEFQATRVQ